MFDRTLEEGEEVPEAEDLDSLKTAYEKAEEQEQKEEQAEKQEQKTKPKRKAKKKDLVTENA